VQTLEYAMMGNPADGGGTLWMIQQMCNHGTLIEAGAAHCPAAWLQAAGRPAWRQAEPPCLPQLPTCSALPTRVAEPQGPSFTLIPPRVPAAVDRGWVRKKRSLTAPPSMPSVLRTLREVASGMAFLHSRDIMHCDLTGGF
jgi:hypothetical protein